MKRHEADKEHRQNQEHVGAHLPFRLAGVPNCSAARCSTRADAGLGAGVGSVQLFGDQRVAHDHRHQVAPENNLTDVIHHLVPVEPCLCFQVAALDLWGGRGFACQDHVGQAQKQQEGPDGSREELATGQPGRIRPPEGLDGLPAAVDADEAEEEDADVHGEVEEHRGDPAHEYAQPGGGHVGVC